MRNLTKLRNSYECTIYACYIGYITGAIANNFAPLLFITFMTDLNLTLTNVTLITTVNFAVQLLVDLLSARVIDKIGYRISIAAAHIFAALGLVGLAFLPQIMWSEYAGILTAVVLYAIGGGITEVLISPIVEACPTEKKEAAMSLLHSFYCWGQLAVILLSTVFFKAFGIQNWRILACIWAIVPAFNFFFFLVVPIYPIVSEREKISFKNLLTQKILYLLLILMMCSGASEIAMSQWASAFAESGLHVSKAAGDLMGPCAFALFMGLARTLYGKKSDKLPLKKFMEICSAMCIVCYLIASLSKNPVIALIGCALCGFTVGIFWPGTLSMAAQKIPRGGTAMYALMALAGDMGASAGPTVVGFVANVLGGNLKYGLLIAAVFPVVMLLGICKLKD